MTAYLVGVALFLLALTLSVALHEAGHMLTARAFGMKVRRFFVGRGPTVFSFRRGEIEYGVKALPIGGFCDIAGLTALDELTPEERPRAMWRFPTWKRTVVMVSGSAVHLLIALAVLYGMAISTGLPNLHPSDDPIVASTTCVTATCSPASTACAAATSACPAAEAGLRPGDRIVSVAGTPTPQWADVLTAVRAAAGPTPLTVRRGADTLTLTVDVARVTTPSGEVGMMGATPQPPPAHLHYGPLAATGATLAFTADMASNTAAQLAAFPQRLPSVIDAITGGERHPDTPISMVGASRLGGEAVERGLWEVFVLLLASLNLFMAVFNLLPLLPLDGGHIAVVWYERLRDTIRRLRGRGPAGPVDYTRLFPITMAALLVGGAVMLLTVTADLVNPIHLS
ncbi:M50 family metallopeptidase [Paractinoplanes atraurantiacus]|uniref:Membrane-associated protease RseP, regulator of RpoE activity n=1 Tax=Paractinoplanes atraurantiacus TaxID=1036182 RepID=A0A285K864_9ACTN|nr:site-2 protease family protein [Actinoplanes atraurantiacus]SNY68780.1 Membrane-associated protease RseP, regulator of RpoE activity [Actinoplanes atraurantiacus]